MPPTFVSSELDIDAGVLTITFSETIDAANIVPARMHVRESGTYTGGVTLTAPELVTVSDGTTVSFTLTPSHLATVAGLATPELTIEPGAVRDASGNLIVGTFDASTRTFVDATSISEQEDIPTDIAFSNDGTRMFVIGNAGDDVTSTTCPPRSMHPPDPSSTPPPYRNRRAIHKAWHSQATAPRCS